MQSKPGVMDILSISAVALAMSGYLDESRAASTPEVAKSSVASNECSALKSLAIPNTTILSAQQIPAGSYTPPGSKVAFDDLPAFCRLTANVTPVPGSSIGIEIWLPSNTWNGRYQQVGTHGLGGVFYWSEMAPQLRRGFATGATDTGHSASEGPSAWAIGAPERIKDFAYRAVHELADKAKIALKAYYGKPQEFAYFNGCSKGGGDAMKSAQMYPYDFNGIIAGGAAAHVTHGSTAQLIQTLNLKNAGIQGPRGIEILKLAQRSAIAACDALDGVTDGIISNPSRCNWSASSLICKPGQDPATCITSEQSAALTANVAEVVDPASGGAFFPGQSRGAEHDQTKFGWTKGLSFAGLAVYQMGLGDANWDGSTFDFRRDSPIVDKVLQSVNAIDPDLSAFKKAGGKLIQWHSWDDSQFQPLFQIHYYEQVAALMDGIQNVEDFYRLFMVPAQGHCSGSGVGPSNIGGEGQIAVSNDAQHDVVTALQTWVEQGKAPNQLIATRFANKDGRQEIDMQRPICRYPLEAVYKGSGNPNAASSFYCGTLQP